MWGGCGSTGIPQLQANSSSCTFTFDVVHISGVSTSSTGGCGEFRPSFNNSHNPPTINGGTIVVWDVTRFGNDCEVYRSETIAHELGHGLGLGDSSCVGYMMGPPQLGGGGRSVQSDECQQVDSLWTTPAESGGGGGDGDGCGPPQTTIVNNLDNGPYSLTGLDDPVSFDLSATGKSETVGWTLRGASEAFLWLDRNGNGKVDDGAALFGSATPMPTGGHAPNGFAALAGFDSDGDGIIDTQDPVWESLLLWIDRNHDGVSQADEIMPLADTAITAIELVYHWTGRHDEYGNTFRYEGQVHEGRGRKPVYDVVFVVKSSRAATAQWLIAPTCAY
jgi:hypothetical protein